MKTDLAKGVSIRDKAEKEGMIEVDNRHPQPERQEIRRERQRESRPKGKKEGGLIYSGNEGISSGED